MVADDNGHSNHQTHRATKCTQPVYTSSVMEMYGIRVKVFWLEDYEPVVASKFIEANMGDMDQFLRFILQNNKFLCLKPTNRSNDFIVVVSLKVSQLGNIVDKLNGVSVVKWNNATMIQYLFDNIVRTVSIADPRKKTRMRHVASTPKTTKQQANATSQSRQPAEKQRRRNEKNTSFVPIQQEWGRECKPCHVFEKHKPRAVEEMLPRWESCPARVSLPQTGASSGCYSSFVNEVWISH